MKNKVIFTSSLLITALTITSPVFAQAADVTKIQTFIQTIVGALSILAGSICTLYLGWGGFKYMSSTDNPEALDGAKRTIKNSLIGLVIVLAAFSIMTIVSGAATSAFGGSH